MRHRHCRRQREVRPARGQPGNHARVRRHPAPAALHEQGEGDGPVPHGAHHGRPGSRARGTGVARCTAGQAAGRSILGGREDCRLLGTGGDDDQGIDQPRLRDLARRGRPVRAAHIPVAIRARGPEGRHGGISGEAQAELQEPINRTALTLLAAHILSMLGFSTYAALLPELRDAWHLSNSQAGIVGGMFFAGYVATVSLATAMTDRLDARRVYLAGAVAAAFAGAGFGVAADGFWSAIAFQVILGAGIAATYMPGLRLLSDRISGPYQSRYIAFYTSFFGIGTALSFAIAGLVTPLYGWRSAFLFPASGPLLAGLAVFAFIDPRRPSGAKALSHAALFPLAAWRKVLANRAAAGFTFGYAAHCLELFGSRAWMVAFLAYSVSVQSGPGFPWHAAAIAAAVNLVAVPASIVGNEVALRLGRRRWIVAAMTSSGTMGLMLAIGAPWHWALVLAMLTVYSMLVMAESGTLTAGLVAAVPGELRGAALGLYSLAGFGGGLLGPVLFGAALDAAGGAASQIAWIAAYGAIGAGCLAAPLVVRMNPKRTSP